jgi:hypothetical protein
MTLIIITMLDQYRHLLIYRIQIILTLFRSVLNLPPIIIPLPYSILSSLEAHRSPPNTFDSTINDVIDVLRQNWMHGTQSSGQCVHLLEE